MLRDNHKESVRQIATSDTHALILSTNGKLYISQEFYYSAQLKPGSKPQYKHFIPMSTHPQFIREKVQITYRGEEKKQKIKNEVIIQIAALDYFNLVLTESGRIYTSGKDGREYGIAPNASPEFMNKFLQMDILNGKKIIQVEVSNVTVTNTLYVLTSEGRVYSGDVFKTSKPREFSEVCFPEGTKITSMTGNFNHCLFLADDGRVYAYGDVVNYIKYVELASGLVKHGEPVEIIIDGGQSKIIQIATNENLSLYLTENGDVYRYYHKKFNTEPEKIYPKFKFKQVKTSWGDGYLLTDDGKVFMISDFRDKQIQILNNAQIKEIFISPSGSSTCARTIYFLDSDNKLHGFGNNRNFQLGYDRNAIFGECRQTGKPTLVSLTREDEIEFQYQNYITNFQLLFAEIREAVSNNDLVKEKHLIKLATLPGELIRLLIKDSQYLFTFRRAKQLFDKNKGLHKTKEELLESLLKFMTGNDAVALRLIINAPEFELEKLTEFMKNYLELLIFSKFKRPLPKDIILYIAKKTVEADPNHNTLELTI